MPVRLLTRADVSAVRDLYQAAVTAGALDFWLYGINRDWQVADLIREIEAGDAIPLGYFQPAATLRGFFLVRKSGLPAINTAPPMPERLVLRTDAWQLWLWITELGLSAAQYKTALDGLFDTGWFSRMSGKLCWGVLPRDLIPARAKTYLDNRFTYYDYEADGVTWRIWVHEP